MKKFLKLAAIACAAVLFVSCGAKDDKSLVKETMESYISASLTLDYAKVKSLVTPESVTFIEQAEEMMKNLPEEAIKMAKESAKAANISFDAESIVIDGDKATVNMSTMGMNIPMSLKKVDGKWLIDQAATSSGYDEIDEVDVEANDSTDVEEVEIEEVVVE